MSRIQRYRYLQGELPLPEPKPVRLQGVRKGAVETGRNRMLVTAVLFALMFMVVGGRLVDIAVVGNKSVAERATPSSTEVALAKPVVQRADIVDRNGVLLATSLPTVSLSADPRMILDPQVAADRLARVLPDLDRDWLAAKLSADTGFVWLRRNLTPRQQYAVNRLGIPGLHFRHAERRVYPHGRETAHVLGFTDLDGHGIAGLERHFNPVLADANETLRTTLDIRLQAALREELTQAVAEFKARGAAGLVMDVNSGEVLAMVSLPDFDPNLPGGSLGDAGFNRVTKGVYEMGSTFKLLTAAMALDAGTVTLDGGYDASKPIHVARFTISDYHAQNRWLSVPEILIHSSNIGAAKMAMDLGSEAQRSYLARLGLLDVPSIELPEVASPLVPARWRDVNTMTISYGHGIAVSPLQMAVAIATVANGGVMRPATLRLTDGYATAPEKRAISAATSQKMRGLMRLVVEKGTGRQADVPGFQVGGKTGTAEKLEGGVYRHGALISSFVGVFPVNAPRYVVLAMVDEPKGTKRTLGYATGGWVAAPVVGHMVARMAPTVGILPQPEPTEAETIPARRVAARGPAKTLRGQRLAAH